MTALALAAVVLLCLGVSWILAERLPRRHLRPQPPDDDQVRFENVEGDALPD